MLYYCRHFDNGEEVVVVASKLDFSSLVLEQIATGDCFIIYRRKYLGLSGGTVTHFKMLHTLWGRKVHWGLENLGTRLLGHLSAYWRNKFGIALLFFLSMILILFLIHLTSSCATSTEGNNHLVEQCKMQALRDYLNTVVRISFRTGAFKAETGNCTATLKSTIPDSSVPTEFGICEAEEASRCATLCLSRYVNNGWILQTRCNVRYCHL